MTSPRPAPSPRATPGRLAPSVLALSIASVVALAGCADATSLLVRVTSAELTVPEDVDSLSIHVVGDQSGQMADASFDLAGPFPHSISVRPGRSRAEAVTVMVTASKRSASGGPERFVVRRVARSQFVDGETALVVLELTRVCVGVMCPEGIDCVQGICTAPQADGGVPDAMPDARDAGTDTGELDTGPDVRDLGTDLGPPPPGCRTLDCDDGDDCTSDSCADVGGEATCVHTTRDLDGDGHGSPRCPEVGGVPADDCDDGDDTLSPSTPESCNGRDDDCDTACDEDFECCRGESRDCSTVCGSTGTRSCGDDCSLGECVPPVEQCNGVDDDCDGPCDEDWECCFGVATECTTSCGTTGSQECLAGCVLGPCTPPAERCNGADDDCDGDVDEGFGCAAGATTSCTTTCGSMGTATCSASCAPGACMPPAEVCSNARDDDCDGVIDEDCPVLCNQACAGALLVTEPGGRFTRALVPGSQAGSCGGMGGSEALMTFTLTAPSDVFVSTHASPGVDTVVYLRACRCTGPEVACSDDSDGVVSTALALPSLPAGTYNVIIDSKSSMSASVDVDLYISPPAVAGDHCGSPLRFTGPSAMGNTCGLTSDVSGMCEFPESLNGPDRVYYFVVPPGAPRIVTFDTSTGCTTYDTSLDIHRSCTASSGPLATVTCNDDGQTSSCSMGTLQSRVDATLDPGLYFVFVDGYGTSCGAYTLTSAGL